MAHSFPILKLEMQRGEDCGLACIASITGYRYEDVLSEASRKEPIGSFPHENGLYLSDMIRIAKRLGCGLKKKKTCNFKEDEGILAVGAKNKRFTHHVVVVAKGLIFDLSDMTVWEPEEYRKAYKMKFGAMLVPT